MDSLCMRGCSQAFEFAQEVGIAVALVPPYGDTFVYNPSAREAADANITGCVEVSNFNVPDDAD